MIARCDAADEGKELVIFTDGRKRVLGGVGPLDLDVEVAGIEVRRSEWEGLSA